MGNRISANYLRKFFPSLRRESTPEGRKWTFNGETYFNSLNDVIDFIQKPSTFDGDVKIAENLSVAEKEVSDVAGL